MENMYSKLLQMSQKSIIGSTQLKMLRDNI